MRSSVTIKDQSFCKKSILKIQGCCDSIIYVNAAVEYVSISNCENCTIFICAVRKVCAVEKCEKLALTVSSNLVSIGNTIDSKFHTYSTFEPILFGDNKSLVMGPNNANYVEMIDKLKKAEISFSTKSLINFSYPFIFHEYWNIANNPIATEPSKDFSVLVLPEDFTPIPSPLSQNLQMILNMDKSALLAKCFEAQNTLIIPFLAPQEYKDKIVEKDSKMKAIREKVVKSGLSKEQLVVLSNAIQGHYREWMMGRSEYKEILDIVRWIKNE